jgi:cytochrome c oxidase assembly protein subunit 15
LTVAAWILTALLAGQIVYGAFVAGLDAGYMFNTFPKMLGRWVPPGLDQFEPAWVNLVQNATCVQFIHRWLGGCLLAGVLAFWWVSRKKHLARSQRNAVRLLAGLTATQFCLGVATLLLKVPVSLATLHQVMACLLLGAALWVNHSLMKRTPQEVSA